MCNPLHSNLTHSSSDATTNGAAEVFCVQTKGFESSSVDTEPSGIYKQLDKADTATTSSDAMMMNGNDFIGMFSVPTKGSKEAEESSQKQKIVDTRHLNAQDLKTLKKQDPFLYYSLPSSVRRNAATADGKSSTPTTKLTSTTVERKSCISFECHPDLVLEDEWLNDDDADAVKNEGSEVDVDFDSLSLYDQLLRRPILRRPEH
jgi:hypothetical protein